jgi:hypothetical protein
VVVFEHPARRHPIFQDGLSPLVDRGGESLPSGLVVDIKRHSRPVYRGREGVFL